MDTDDRKLDDEERELKIKGGQDGDPPFSEPDDVPQLDERDLDGPATDAEIDSTEAYNAGLKEASGQQTDENPDEDEHAIRLG